MKTIFKNDRVEITDTGNKGGERYLIEGDGEIYFASSKVKAQDKALDILSIPPARPARLTRYDPWKHPKGWEVAETSVAA